MNELGRVSQESLTKPANVMRLVSQETFTKTLLSPNKPKTIRGGNVHDYVSKKSKFNVADFDVSPSQFVFFNHLKCRRLNSDFNEEEKVMRKKALVLAFVSQLVILSVAGVQFASGSETEYPLASGIYIISPFNRTYTPGMLTLNVSINIIVASNIRVSMTYSVDGLHNKTIPLIIYTREDSFQARITGSVILPTLSYGTHNVTVFAEHTVNNELVHWDNSTVYFTISDTIPLDELIPPIISNLSLENKTYNSTELLLSFNIDKTASWTAYCLDNQGNRTITFLYDINRWGNQVNKTLTGLTEGSHKLTVYANNTAGNTGTSETVYFTVSSNSEQELPEFPLWTIFPILLVLTLAVITVRNKLRKNG